MADDQRVSPEPSAPGELPGADEVSLALAQVLASGTFRGARRSRDFLSYVVTETLAGRGDRLSERTVGRHGLRYGDEFDGRLDASVRVRATRVRRALQEYHAGEGAADAVRIDLPPGGYQPEFSRGAPASTPFDDVEPKVAVLVFEAAGREPAAGLARMMAEELVQRLASFPGLRIVGPATVHGVDPRQIGRELRARYVLQGSVMVRESDVRLSARLSDGGSGEAIWAIADTVQGEASLGVAEDWAGAVAGELGDYSGVVFRADRQRAEQAPGSLEHAARLAYYRYIELGGPQALAAARAALEEALAAGHRSPVVLSMAASALAAGVAEGYRDDAGDLEQAERYAREALALEPRNAHAHCALGTVAMAREQADLVVQHGREAARLAPDHPSILLTGGLLVALGGSWDEGIAIYRRALGLMPAHPGYLHALLAADRLMAQDDAGALAEASVVTGDDTPWGYLHRSLALAGLGHLERAKAEFAGVLRLMPDFLDDPYTHMAGHRMLTRERLAPLVERVDLIAAALES